jgi:hypothetical protein
MPVAKNLLSAQNHFWNKGESIAMLKIGLYLLSTCTVGSIYRTAHLEESLGLGLKWACLIGLCASLACFIGVYVRAEVPLRRKPFHLPDMIKSSAWKLSSMA